MGLSVKPTSVITGSSSYATNGDTVPLSTIGLGRVDAIEVPSHRMNGMGTEGQGSAVTTAQSRTGKTLELDGTNLAPKLKVYDTANTEVSNATNLSSISWVVKFIGV